MLNFVARVFRAWMNVLLWLLLIGCAIGGFVAGGTFLGFNGGYAFLGLIIGGLIGLITVILSGGLIANFLNMVDNIEKLVKGNLPSEVSNVNSANEKSTKSQVRSPLPSSGDEYKVTLDTFIRNSPNFDANKGKHLDYDEKVIIQNASYENQDWYFIKTSDGNEGWCFKNHLTKC